MGCGWSFTVYGRGYGCGWSFTVYGRGYGVCMGRAMMCREYTVCGEGMQYGAGLCTMAWVVSFRGRNVRHEGL